MSLRVNLYYNFSIIISEIAIHLQLATIQIVLVKLNSFSTTIRHIIVNAALNIVLFQSHCGVNNSGIM